MIRKLKLALALLAVAQFTFAAPIGDPLLDGVNNSITFGDGSQATFTHTNDVSGTDTVITYGSGVINVSTGALQVGGVAVLTTETNALESQGTSGIADTEVFIGTGAGTGNYAALSGDATMANTGAVTLAAGITRDAEWDTAAEINAATTDDDFVTLTGAQSLSTGTKTITSKFDFGGGTLEVPNSTSLPGTCVVGDTYMDTDAAAGQKWFLCISTNNWEAQGGSGTNPLSISSPEALTIATGAVTLTGAANTLTYHTIDTESAAASDDLDTINCTAGSQHVIYAADSARTVVVNAPGSAAFSLDNANDRMALHCVATNTVQELSRANGGA